MFHYNDSEASHLAEMYDDADCYQDEERYSDWEKAQYIAAKSQCFSKSDIGKFVVIQKSRKNKKIMPFMYLVDRNKTKRWWWSPSAFFAMVFEKQSAAEIQARKYKYNNPKVKQITKSMANMDYFIQEYDY